MKRTMICKIWPLLVLAVISVAALAPLGSTVGAEVCVYGGTSGGVIAALAAARQGKRVVLIEPGRHLGGMSSGGLGWTDNGATDTIGGLSREFYERIYRYYSREEAWKHQTRDDYKRWLLQSTRTDGHRIEELKAQFLFEPHAAEEVFNDLVREAGVEVEFGERLDLKQGVRKQGSRIESIVMESGREFTAGIFIDTTYEGDLMARCGVTYIVGREPNSRYGETLNGVYPFTPAAFTKISPYIIAGDPASGLLPRVETKPPGIKGIGDHRVQTYNFRLCLTDVPENRVLLTRPANYDPLDYELLYRFITTLTNVKPGPRRNAAIGLRGQGGDLGINFELVPNRKTDSNCGSEFGSDYFGRSYDWPEADYAGRQRIWEDHKNYTLGLLWFLATDPRLPVEVRTEMQRWGLAKDEFTDTENFPRQLYVREARRMVSDYVVTEHEAQGVRVAKDGVALGSYPLDSHGVTLFIDEAGVLHRERGYFLRINPFPISYRAIRPKAGECDNLLVPCCLSASHASYGSVRMEPVFMMLGHAAGTAASLAIDKRVSVQDVPYAELRRRLLAEKQFLETPNARSANAANSLAVTPSPADPEFQAALAQLVAKKIVDAPDYWLLHARDGQSCHGYMVEALFLGMAKTFERAYTRPDVIKILAERQVISSPETWADQALPGKECPGPAVREAILRFVAASESVRESGRPSTRKGGRGR
jgi:FAD dependent oxidoreductase